MGTLEALYFRMLGGVVPGGKMRSTVCEMAVTCAEGQIDARLGLEKDLGDGDAAVGRGFHVFDVVDGGGEGALVDGDEALFHLSGETPE